MSSAISIHVKSHIQKVQLVLAKHSLSTYITPSVSEVRLAATSLPTLTPASRTGDLSLDFGSLVIAPDGARVLPTVGSDPKKTNTRSAVSHVVAERTGEL
jgi:hypothetical protein